MATTREVNPFVFGEIVAENHFVDREDELNRLIRELSDGQKVFLLSPRRFGKSSLVSLAFNKLKAQQIRTVVITVSSYASYSQFLEKFSERVLRAAGPWEQVKDLATHFLQRIQPSVTLDPRTGEYSLTFGRQANLDPTPIAPDVFALPGELSSRGNFQMAICLDEFQQISKFDTLSVESAIRDAVQRQRRVGYVFAGSQPSVMHEMLTPSRPFYRTGPVIFLDKIPADAWKPFIMRNFERRHRTLAADAQERILEAADLIPYDVQRIAHELWDYAELEGKRELDLADVNRIIDQLVIGNSVYYERLWGQLSARQRAVLQALAEHGPTRLLSEDVRRDFRLGPPSSVQKALQSLEAQDILDRYHKRHFFLDPLFAFWIRRSLQ